MQDGERQGRLEQRRLEQRLAQQRRDLEQRERAMPIDWYEERVAEAARRFEEAAKPWLAEIFGAYDADGDGRLSQSEYGSYLQGIRLRGEGSYTDDNFAERWVKHCAGLESDPQEGVSWEQFQRKLYGEYRSGKIGADLATVRMQQSQGDRETAAEVDVAQATIAGQQLTSRRKDLESRKQESAEPFITGRDFHREVIKKDTHTLLCRYVELRGCGDAVDADGGCPSVGAADAFVSWNWDSQWDLLLLSLEEHTRKAVAAGRPAPHYWLDLFAVNQHTSLDPWKCESGLQDCPGCAAVGEDMPSFEESLVVDKGFKRVINSANCRETLVLLEPWFSPRPISRVWCPRDPADDHGRQEGHGDVAAAGAGRAQQGFGRGSSQRAACRGCDLGGDSGRDDGR